MAGKLETYGFAKIMQIGAPISIKNGFFRPIQLCHHQVTKDPNLSHIDASPTFGIVMRFHNAKTRKQPIYVSLDQFKRVVIQEEVMTLRSAQIYFLRIERDPGHPKLGNNWLVTVAKDYDHYFRYKADLLSAGTFFIGRPKAVRVRGRPRPSPEVISFYVQLSGGQTRVRGTRGGIRGSGVGTSASAGTQPLRGRPNYVRK